ncbi:hypothetical protein PHYPSEUDO_009295 [Phytophthora pseudosyringae]|uniref:Tubulin-tyrosine ligase family protein n=1 Tax=Phytophthora pseudosyringae TaxID=221518 RepID=A0A8T1VFK6_9STRA|nr:hypothetical protein PHYPSEUDO_009295 [Phytophthora pseudosyringae]
MVPPAVEPRTRRPRPASAVSAVSSQKLADDKVENMLQAAHEHLGDRSCRPMTREEDGGHPTARLADHMDSFPLVPLPVIAQLGIGDLEKVERGLNDLLGSLMPHESDHLGRYASRQLGLVQRQLTQQRAQERVFRMLRGDVPATLAPLGANTLRKSSSAAAAVQISASSPSTPANNQTSEASSSPLPRTSANGAASQHWKSKKAAVETARAMVHANASKTSAAVSRTSFMISAGDNGSRKRRRPRAPAKRTPEEEALVQAQKLERERDNRRQAAFQRLQARRELQATRKQESKRQEKGGASAGKYSSGGAEQAEKERDSDSDGDSETSDVSNCSESDEANEKTILALAVQIEPSVDEVEDSPRTDRSDSADDDGGDKASKDEGAGVWKTEGVNLQAPDCDSCADPDNPVPESETLGSERPETSDASQVASAISIDAEDDEAGIAVKMAARLQESDSIKRTSESEANQLQLDQEETIAFNLQSFVASRATAKLEQLRAEKAARESVADPLSDSCSAIALVSEEYSSTSLASSPRPSTGDCEDTGKKGCESVAVTRAIATTEATCSGSEPSDTKVSESSLGRAADNQPSSWIDEVRRSAGDLKGECPERVKSAGRTRLSLPRAPVAECKDYSFYFSNFHCILTSVFEQCRSSASTSSSSSSLYHRPVAATGDHTMRLQGKLYESWQSIMQDYATVFGPKIVVPEGMIPVAAAKPWAPHYRINSTARKEVSEIVTQALQRLGGGWEEHASGLGLKTTWNLLWTWSKPRVERQTLLAWQKVNHFQHAKALTRKDCLKKHIGKYLAAGGRLRQAFDIIPPTFLLPKEYVTFVQAFQERSERLRRSGFSEGKNIWIMKPVALSRGRGISLVNDLSQVIYGEQVVIQEYIAAPRLLDGFKFDLRLYVLVTSFNPLEAFLYDEGFVRLCTRPYEDGDISNVFIHLTNSSIQKDNEEAIAGSANPIASAMKEGNASNRSSKEDIEGGAAQKDAGGTKTTLAYLWRRLAAEGVDVEQVKRSIEEVVLKALLCGEDQIPFQVNSFDLLGYDILLDADLRPWLIEINSSPSMARDNDLDYQVKDAMMLDTLRVVDPLHFDRAKLAEVIARRQRDLEDEKRRPHAHTRHPREAEELAARQLNEDLTAILRGKLPRAYGEIPENIGNYRRLCPHTNIYNQLVKLKRSCLRVGERRA